MAQAPRDQNHVPSKLGVLFSDGVTKIPIAINGTSGGIEINQTDVISYTPVDIDPKDENFVNVWLFEGSDGKTYPANVDADGKLLVDVI